MLDWAIPGQVCMEGRGEGPQGRAVSGDSSEEEEDVEGPGESIMGDEVCPCLGDVTRQCAGESPGP